MNNKAPEAKIDVAPVVQAGEGGLNPTPALQSVFRHTSRNGVVEVHPVSRAVGKAMIVAGHYSHKNVNTSTVYLGLFVAGRHVGVASLGCAMNALPTCKLVPGTSLENYLELNRLWIDDCVDGNIESVFIALVMKWLRRFMPMVWWVQSFADGRLGVGTIYQAANFTYYGHHKSVFWRDKETGEVFHNSILTRKTRSAYARLSARREAGMLEAFSVRTRRYIYFLEARRAADCVLKKMPYPKTVVDD